MANKVPPPSGRDNIGHEKAVQSLGFAIEGAASAHRNADYYRWNQWLFTRLSGKASLQEDRRRNWDPVEKTCRQRAGDRGRGWRHGATVEKSARSRLLLPHHRIPGGAPRCAHGMGDGPTRSSEAEEWIGKSKATNRFEYV